MKRRAIIISIQGPYLTKKEKNLLKFEKPWGIILFKRNITSSTQLINLTKSIRKSINDKRFPIIIDEEGGRVTRLDNILCNSFFSQKYFGDLYLKNKKLTKKIYNLYTDNICKHLKNLGINFNTTPVLDLMQKNTGKIIGSRSYSSKIKIVRDLGNLCIKNYKKSKIINIVKHIPGHGCTSQDSHFVMPIVNKSLNLLIKSDFACFENTKSMLAMCAHIKYRKIDNKHVSTFSRKIIKKIIRKKLKFKGLIISDDISMKALKFDIVENAKKSLEAGCNIALYCSGKYLESKKLLKSVPFIDEFTIKKTSTIYKYLS